MTRIAGSPTIVTGGGSGIGKAIAVALARAGAKVLVADLDGDAARKAADEIAGEGREAIGMAVDITSDDGFAALKDRLEEAYGPLRILVNSAGTMLSGLPQDIPLAEWQRMIDVNFLAVVRANEVFLPGMIARGEGHIVNIASFAGLYPYAFDRLPYAASKAALVTLSEGLALYLKPQGIGVTCLCPGPVFPTGIIGRSRSWSEGIDVRGPGAQFSIVSPEAVGELAVEAIEADLFFVPTDPQVRAVIQERAADLDAFIDKRIAAPQIVVHARPKTV